MSTQTRTWRGTDGKFAVEATFGGLFQKTKVKLVKTHGGTVAIPLDRLCQEDQEYVNQLLGPSSTRSKPDIEHHQPRSPPQPQPQPQPQPEGNNGHTPQHDNSTILAYARMENKTSPGLASFLRESVTGNSLATPEKRKKPITPLQFPPASDATLIAAVDRLATSPRSPLSPRSPTISMSKSFFKSVSKSTPRPEKKAAANPVPKPVTASPASPTSSSGSEPRSYAPLLNPHFKKKNSIKQQSLLLTLPHPVLTTICEHLDIRSIIYLTLRVSKSLTAQLDNPQAKAFGVITFLPEYHYLIDHRFVLALASYLKRHNVLQTVHTIIYDSTKVQELTVMYTFEHFSGLRHLSLQKCWDIHSYPLANLLARRNATRSQDRIRLPHLRTIEFGKMLRRGDVPGGFLIVKSESYGQDIGLIGLALRGLAGHDVKFDTYLCGTCDRGAAKPIFDCTFCGPVATKKCWTCAPKCERSVFGNMSCHCLR